jgi:hypothetical protein
MQLSRRTFAFQVLPAVALSGVLGLTTSLLHAGAPRPIPALPFDTVFQGTAKFEQLLQQAETERWAALPLGQRTATVGRALLGTPYVNYTLELDDHIEAVSVNFNGMDCWTFFEAALGFSRMLTVHPPPYQPQDLLRMIELERYRNGRCTGSYVSRLHHLEDWIFDNARRGLVQDLNRVLGGVRIVGRKMDYMATHARHFRYLRNDRSLVPKIAAIEREISNRPIYHIPKRAVPSIENQLRDGDVICISTTWPGTFTSHVGLAWRDEKGVLRFMHASRDTRMVMVDDRLSGYLNRFEKHAGIMVARPLEISPATFTQTPSR